MEVKYIILSVACFSCLVPPAYSSAVLAAKTAAVAGAAVKGAALGAEVLAAKVLALKGAALVAAKGVAAKSAALLAAKGALVKGAAAVAAKGALLGGTAVLGAKAIKTGAALAVSKQPIFIRRTALPGMVYPIPPLPSVVVTPPKFSTIIDRLLKLANVTKNSIQAKTTAVGDLLSSLLPTKTVVTPPPLPPLVYRVVTAPKFYSVPVIQTMGKKKK